jgi:hypothetical protein
VKSKTKEKQSEVKKKRKVPKRRTQLYWETSEQGRKETQGLKRKK